MVHNVCIFSQDVESNDVYYYSTLPQVHELFSTLDPNYYEQYLCKALRNMLPSIAQQMRITLELTDERRFNLQRKTQRESPYPYLHVDNIHRMSSIVADVVLYGEETSQENIDQNDSVLDMKLLKSLLCIEDGHLVDEFWTGQQNGLFSVIYKIEELAFRQFFIITVIQSKISPD